MTQNIEHYRHMRKVNLKNTGSFRIDYLKATLTVC